MMQIWRCNRRLFVRLSKQVQYNNYAVRNNNIYIQSRYVVLEIILLKVQYTSLAFSLPYLLCMFCSLLLTGFQPPDVNLIQPCNSGNKKPAVFLAMTRKRAMLLSISDDEADEPRRLRAAISPQPTLSDDPTAYGDINDPDWEPLNVDTSKSGHKKPAKHVIVYLLNRQPFSQFIERRWCS